MLNHVVLRHDLFLVQQEVVVPKTGPAVVGGPQNHILIYDRSGSMSGSLYQLGEDLIERCRRFEVGDTITLGYFASEGDHRFILSGFKITEDPKDMEILSKTIRNNISSRGCTCFSEILEDTDQVLTDLQAFGNNFSLGFFTDGHPVVSNYTKEITNIRKAIERLDGRLCSAMVVGYGNYYNKTLLTEMADWFGGSMVHSSSLGDFNLQHSMFIEESRDKSPRVIVPILHDEVLYGTAFSVADRMVTTYAIDGSRNVAVAPSKSKKNFVYTLTKVIPTGSKEIKLTDSATTAGAKHEPLVKAVYAAAYMLTQKAKTQHALDALAALGDVHIIDQVNNAFTNDEYGRAESEMMLAMTGPSKRFKKGRKLGYLPAENAFCILDLLDVLQNDNSARFYPRHESFKYERIGNKTAAKDGFPTFKADDDVAVDIDALVWNQSKLNLSIRTCITGTVQLTGEYAKHGFAQNYPTYIWRNYAVVKDGFVNITELPCSFSEDTFNRLKAEGVVDAECGYVVGGVYLLHLDRIPVINRTIANGRTSARDLCLQVIQENRIAAQLKVLRSYSGPLTEKIAAKRGQLLSAEQEAYLVTQGVTKNGFNPPSEKQASVDFYMAKDFEVKIKGLSAIPKVDDVRVKLAKIAEDGKGSLTLSQKLVAEAIEYVEKLRKGKTDKVFLAALEDEIKSADNRLRAIRRYIRETMFSILLSKNWFDEFPNRVDTTLTLDEFECTVSLTEDRVEF